MSRALIFFVILVGLLTACSQSQEATPLKSEVATATPVVLTSTQELEATTSPATDQPVAKVETSEVVVATLGHITTLEPFKLIGMHPAESIAAHLWDTLVWIDDSQALQPGLAMSWQLTNDHTWTFNLQKDVKFHNGEPFDAAAAKFSLERAASLEGSLTTYAENIPVESIDIIDDFTLQIKTSQPVANLPYLLSGIEMLPPLYYTEATELEVQTKPVGSGPYRLVEWQPGQSLVLAANPDYWRGPAAISKLTFMFAQDPAQLVDLLNSGQANLVADLTPEQTDQIDQQAARFVNIDSLKRLYVGFKIAPESPLFDLRVRQALNYAVDVQALIKDYQYGYGTPYGSWVNPPNNNPQLTPFTYDPVLAKNLLVEAGYPAGFTIEMDAPAGRYLQDEQIVQAITDYLKAIGVEVKLTTYPWETYVTRLGARDTAPLFLLSLNSRGDALEDTSNLSFSFPYNPAVWSNQEFEKLLEEARSTFNDQQRQTLLFKAQALAYKQAPWLWLWRLNDFYGVSNNLKWQPRPDGLIYLYQPAQASKSDTE